MWPRGEKHRLISLALMFYAQYDLRILTVLMDRFATTSLVLPSTASQLMPPPGKRLLEKDPVIMVPVHVDDFKKLNEFAESAWVQREVTKTPGQAEKLMNNIKDTRRRLLNQVSQAVSGLYMFLAESTP